ncbi:hypothetical protein [Acinetobacter boissieri]|nr:hypothetical protein [Acinetobacter boissieri]
MKKMLTVLVLLLATPFSLNTSHHSSMLPLDKYITVATTHTEK